MKSYCYACATCQRPKSLTTMYRYSHWPITGVQSQQSEEVPDVHMNKMG